MPLLQNLLTNQVTRIVIADTNKNARH